MQRYFILEDDNWKEKQVMITGDDVHHIRRVMRAKSGDEIICVDGEGQAALCEIHDISDDHVTAYILEWLQEDAELPVDVTIAQGLPKGDKFEFILQKGTELGATGFIPVQAERSVAVWDNKKMRKKVKRFKKIVKEASEQCHRSKIPFIEEIFDLNRLLEVSGQYDALLFAYEEEAKKETFQSFAEALKQLQTGAKLLICIRPEGGFSEVEANRLKEHGFQPVRFGPRILRTETAALYALSSISYHFEELGWNECRQ